MKSGIYRFLLFVVISIFVSGNVMGKDNPKGITLVRDGNGYIVNFDLPAYKMYDVKGDGEIYKDLIVEDYGVTPDVGLPKLPQITFNLLIGYNESVPTFSVISQNKEHLLLSNKIYPSQKPWEKIYAFDDRPFVINREYYNSRGSIDNPLVNISGTYVIAGAKGIMVTIYPFAYNPSENQLQITTKGSFRINLNNVPSLNILPAKSFDELYNNMFVNYSPSKVFTPTNNYLIITAPDYESGLGPFVTHKTGLGYNVTVVNTNVTGTTNTAIKAYIQTQYNTMSTRPEFILLVGDVDKIPCWIGGGEGTPHTDWNYALLEGSDLYVDAFLGRFPITNLTQLGNIITKTIYMENGVNSLWKKNVFMASTDNHTISEGTHNMVIDSFFIPNGYNVNTKLYSYYGATTAQVSQSIDSGKIFAIYSGHGAETYWADGPVFSQSNVNALNNTIFPFVYSFACITGSYHISGECFAETWIRSAKAASVFWGSSVNSYWTEDDILERKIVKSLFVDGLKKNAQNFVQGKIYTIQYFGSITPTMQRYIEMYNCMGDPSIYQVSYGPSISHTPLPNTENISGPYTVNCSVTPSGSAIVSTKLFWTRTTAFDSLAMTNSSGTNWTANIPGNNSPATYKYFIRTTDAANRTTYLPGGAPANYFSFTASVDTVKPVIAHTPIGPTPKSYWPLTLTANVTDNIGIDSVWVEWYKNTPANTKQFKLNLSGANIYSAVFNSLSSDVVLGDVIYYVIKAKDNSSNHNTTQLPLTGFYNFAIVNLRLYQGFWSSTFPPNGWLITGSGAAYWTRNDASSYGIGNGSARFNFYSATSGVTAALNSLQFDPSSSGDSMRIDIAHAYYGATYIDTLKIEASTDAGTTYTLLAKLWSNTNFSDPNSLSTVSQTALFVPTSSQWKTKKYLLPTGTNKVRFTAVSGYGNDMFLDSISQISNPTGIGSIGNTIPLIYSLSQNYPNPFNPVTKINFALPKANMTTLKVYDLLGREVMRLVNNVMQPGIYSVDFDGTNLSSGVYFYKLESGTFSDVKRMVLIK